MQTVGKVELDVVEMLRCTGCETTRDPEDYAFVLKVCRRDACGEKAAVDPSERQCPSCEKQSLGAKIAEHGCEDCQEEMEIVRLVICDHCGEPLKCGGCDEAVEAPESVSRSLLNSGTTKRSYAC